MEKEELKGIIKEALREFIEENFEKWRYWWRKWVEEGYPPPWYLLPIRRREIESFKESISELRELTMNLQFFVSRLETWAPQCSERERIGKIEKDINSIKEKIDEILCILRKKE